MQFQLHYPPADLASNDIDAQSSDWGTYDAPVDLATIIHMTKTAQTPKIAMGKFTSSSYGEQVASDTLEAWGIKPVNQIRTTDANQRARTGNLFGIINGTVLTMDSKETAETLLDALLKGTDIDLKAKTPKISTDDKARLTSNATSLAGHGMFVIQNANANLGAVKNLVKLFQAMGWRYTEPAKNASAEINNILKECKLSPDLKRRLSEHVGEQYDLLLPIVKGLKPLTDAQQREMTWEELWMRMNPDPGSIPPWGINGTPGLFDHVIQGDVAKAVAFYQRLVGSGTPVIQFSAWLANQIGQYAMLKLLIDHHGISIDDAAHMVGLAAPSSGRYPDPLTGKRNGWVTEKNYRCIQRRKIKSNVLRQLVKRTADDLTLIKKSGRVTLVDPMGEPVLDDDGSPLIKVIERPMDEVLDDVTVGLRMTYRAAAVFAGQM